MRKVLTGFLIVLALVAAGLAAAPVLVDPEAYRGIVTASLRDALGHEVAIDGPLELTLLPRPSLAARDLRIANPPGSAEPDLLRVGGIELRLAVAPLLAGHLVFAGVTMADPILDLERRDDGRLNLEVPSGAGGSTPVADNVRAIAIERIDITNGRLAYRADGRAWRIDRLDLTARHVADGPINASGTLQLGGARFAVTLETGAPAATMPVSAKLELLGGSLQAQLEGIANLPAEAARSFAGKLQLSGSDLAAALRQLGGEGSPLLARPFTLAGEVVAGGKGARIDRLSFGLGEARADGTLELTAEDPPRFALSLAATQLDLDRLLAPGQAIAGAPPLPAWLKGSLSLTSDAVLWRGGVARDARLEASLGDGAATITRASALLPGGSDFTLSGRYSADAPRLAGTAEGDSDNFRELLGWLGLPVGAVPADRLRKASLAAHFTWEPQLLRLDGLDLMLDASRVTGALTLALRQRLGIGARLAIDRINLDAYLGDGEATGAAALLGAVDANLEAGIATLTWHGEPVRGVRLSASLQQGELAVKEAAADDLAGATLSFGGTLDKLGSATPGWRGHLVVGGAEIARLLRLVPATRDAGERFTGPFTLEGDVEGGPEATALDLKLAALGGALRVSGEMRSLAAAGDVLDLALELSHPSFARLAGTLVPGYRPAGGDPGAVLLAASLRGAPQLLRFSDASLALGSLILTGEGTLDWQGIRPALAGSFAFGALDIERFLPARQAAAATPRGVSAPIWPAAATTAPRTAEPPFDVAALGALDADLTLTGDSLAYGEYRIERPALEVTLKDRRLSIDRLSGGLFGGALEAKAGLDGSGRPRLSLDLDLRQAALRDALQRMLGLHQLAGSADIKLKLAGAGDDPTSLLADLVGEASLHARDGTIAGFDLAAVNDRLRRLDRSTDLFELLRGATGGVTGFETLSGSFRLANGTLETSDLHLMAMAGDAQAAGAIDLLRRSLHGKAELRLAADSNAPPLTLRLDGALAAPNLIFELNAMERYLQQRGAGAAIRTPAQ